MRREEFHVPTLLLEGVEIINKLRRELGVPAERDGVDVVPRLCAVAKTCEAFDSAELTGALQEAANAIYSLQILVDSGFAITAKKTNI